MYRLSRTYELQCAHRLTGVPAEHKCSRTHGHTYVVTVTVESDSVDPLTGFCAGLDFADIDRMVEADVFAYLDHRNLNEAGVATGSTEELARNVFERLVPSVLPGRLVSVSISENSRSRIEYTP